MILVLTFLLNYTFFLILSFSSATVVRYAVRRASIAFHWVCWCILMIHRRLFCFIINISDFFRVSSEYLYCRHATKNCILHSEGFQHFLWIGKRPDFLWFSLLILSDLSRKAVMSWALNYEIYMSIFITPLFQELVLSRVIHYYEMHLLLLLEIWYFMSNYVYFISNYVYLLWSLWSIFIIYSI